MTSRVIAGSVAGVALAAPASTFARVFGTEPINISHTPGGGPKRTIRVGPGQNGGITAYGARRGIVTFFDGGDYYFNEHSGNSDDLAHMDAPILDASTSARGNFVAFSSGGDVWFKHLVDGQRI